MAEEIGFFKAYDAVLTPLFSASSTLSLVEGATSVGLMSALRDVVSTDRLSRLTGLSPQRINTLCRALVATGVAEALEAGHVLTAEWRALTDPGGYVSLDMALSGNAVDGRLLKNASGSTYWSMPSEDRLAYARAVSPNPYSDDLVASFRTEILSDPDRAAMAAGGRLLELGCGVAGRFLTTLRAMPQLVAVGVELSRDLVDEAVRRANDLSVSDRLRVVCADAQSFVDAQPFDFGFWSQFFFPSGARAGALRTMLNSLRPGAVMLAPLGADYDKVRADPSSDEAREYALWRVVLDSWDVPERTPDTLVAEIKQAGFTDVRIVAREGGGPLVRAARPASH